jgi:putative membrane protein
MVGAKYTYAEVPLFDYFKEVFGWTRNNYDKVGHFMQGFSPALIAREVFIRQNIVNGNGWTLFLAVAVPLAFSAFYEFVDWWVAAATGDSAEAFLGTQGYQWDTQTDMFMCLVGSIASLVIFKRLQDKQMFEREMN